jgi:hypothetical protein
LERSQFVHDDAHRSPFRGGHAYKLPSDGAFAIDDEGRWPRNAFLRMEHIIGINVSPQRVGQNGIPQTQVQNGLTRRHLGVRTEGDELGIELLNLFVIRLQLTELRLAKRSGVHPVKYDQDILVTFEVLQVDRNTLHGHTGNIRGLTILRHRRDRYQHEKTGDYQISSRFHIHCSASPSKIIDTNRTGMPS